MAQPSDEFLFDDTFTEDDWQESISDQREDALSRDRAMCKLTIETDFSKYKAAERFVLGYPWVDENLNLRREVPVFHPNKSWLFARSITSTKFHAPNGTSTSDWEHAVKFGVYTYATIEIEFGDTKYTVLRDDECPTDAGTGKTLEYKRYIERRSKPYSELISIDGGQMKAVAPSIAALNGVPFIAAPHVLARLQKSMFTLTWHEVPRSFVETSNGVQTKLELMQKTVNLTAFMDHPAGTLFCEDIDSVPSPSPIATDVFDDNEFMLDITFTFKKFDPTPGDGAVGTRGWNLLPAPRAAGSAGDTMTAWILYTHNGADIGAGGKPLYQSYEFASAFTHVSL